METLEENILKYGSQKEISSLQQLIFKCSEDEVLLKAYFYAIMLYMHVIFILFQLESLVKTSISSSVFSRIWDYLLKAFQDSSKCHQKRIKIILTVLNELEEREYFSSQLSSILVQRLCMDLIKFKTDHLVELCNFCLSSIQSKKASSTIR